jgi:hypothetical protein
MARPGNSELTATIRRRQWVSAPGLFEKLPTDE